LNYVRRHRPALTVPPSRLRSIRSERPVESTSDGQVPEREGPSRGARADVRDGGHGAGACPPGDRLGEGQPNAHTSHSITLPSPYVVPKLLMAFDDVPWFDFDEQVQGILALIDGVRTIAEIARRTATSPGELQLRIADLRDRGVIRVE